MISKKVVLTLDVFLNDPITQMALNPLQYDIPGKIEWVKTEDGNSPMRKFLLRKLALFLSPAEGKILDIGCGTGWYLEELVKAGADAVGIDPSETNYKAGLEKGVKIIHSAFQTFSPELKYDRIYSLMSVIHIWDLEDFFAKSASWLLKKGELVLITPNYDYFRKERNNYSVSVVDFGNMGIYSVLTERPNGKIANIIRENHCYQEAANAAGLIQVKEIAMRSDHELIAHRPDMVQLTPFNLLIYQK